jgi:spore coat protein F
MTQLGDKEIMYTLLNDYKLCASSLTNLIIESSNQALRNDAAGILSRTFQNQKTIFDTMAQKGWYSVQQASQQDISNARNETGKIQSSVGQF